MNLRLFLATLQFMTRIPIPSRWTQGVEMDQYVRGIASFPFVGLIVGTLAAVIFTLLAPWCGVPLAALSYVLVLALLTGALHLDGLADTCDGVFSARSRERMLEIMRDSRLGTHGGLALIFLILAKVLVVSELALRDVPMLVTLIAASVAGRSAIVLLMYRQRCAREGSGLGYLYIGRVNGHQAALTLLSGMMLITLLTGVPGVLALVITLLVIGLLAIYLHRRLGGQTGDTLGASVEIGELVFLLALL